MPAVHQATGKAIDERARRWPRPSSPGSTALRPDLERHYGPDGRARCLQDTEHHLANLSAAISASSPALFSDYLDWARSVLAASDVREEDVEGNLACLQEVLSAALPRGARGGHPPVPGGGDPMLPRRRQVPALPDLRR